MARKCVVVACVLLGLAVGTGPAAAQKKHRAATMPDAILKARRSPSLNKMRCGANRRSIAADCRVHELPQKTIDT